MLNFFCWQRQKRFSHGENRRNGQGTDGAPSSNRGCMKYKPALKRLRDVADTEPEAGYFKFLSPVARRSFGNRWDLVAICGQSLWATCRTPQTIRLIFRILTGITIIRKASSIISKSVKKSRKLHYAKKNASPSAPLSKWFCHFIESVNTCIEQPELKFTSEHVFHSFRHTVRTEFRRNRAPEDDVCRICGWKDVSKNKTLADHYGESVLENPQETINSLKYDGLDLSHLYAK